MPKNFEGKYEVQPKFCSFPKCEENFKPHAWGSKRAASAGWFLQKNGDAWCPKHNPPWVKSWREKNREPRLD